jgi:hypothetical protein
VSAAPESAAAASSTRSPRAPAPPPRVAPVTLRDMLVIAFLACNAAQSCDTNRTARAAIARLGR